MGDCYPGCPCGAYDRNPLAYERYLRERDRPGPRVPVDEAMVEKIIRLVKGRT